MEPDFPIEIVLSGNPKSLQAKRGIPEWKERIADEIRTCLPEMPYLTVIPIAITVYWFSDAERVGDLDNILKPMLDACVGVAFVDDDQVESISAEFFPPSRLGDFRDPSEVLTRALDTDRPCVYFKIDERK